MFKYAVLLAAVLIAICAGWFSLSGISQLFIGAHIAAMTMAGSLELGKLVSVSFVYRYWSSISKVLRTYMLIGAVVLSCVTSLGIYGFLSAAYAKSGTEFAARQNQITLITTQQTSLQSIIQTDQSRISQLQIAQTHQETRLDNLVGKAGLQTQQAANRRSDDEIKRLQNETKELISQKDSLELQKTQQTNAAQSDTKLGTFWYVAKSFGVPLDRVVKWFILLLVFVFDPMAVALIIAYNTIVEKEKMAPVIIKTEPSVVPEDTQAAEPEILTVPEEIIQQHEPPSSDRPIAAYVTSS